MKNKFTASWKCPGQVCLQPHGTKCPCVGTEGSKKPGGVPSNLLKATNENLGHFRLYYSVELSAFTIFFNEKKYELQGKIFHLGSKILVHTSNIFLNLNNIVKMSSSC